MAKKIKNKTVSHKKTSDDLFKAHPNLIWLLPLLLIVFFITLSISNSSY